MIKKILPLIIVATIGFVLMGKAQNVAVKSNLFYAAYTQTPNLGLEISLGNKSTLDITGGYNPWSLDGGGNNNKKLVHWLGNIEYRYWLCERFSGHFFGIHALGTQYNISRHNLPLIFGKDSKNYRFEGYGYGAGISYGYQWVLSKRWSLEANVGVGYARLHYDKYECKKCGDRIGAERRHYLGPTKAGISLIYTIK